MFILPSYLWDCCFFSPLEQIVLFFFHHVVNVEMKPYTLDISFLELRLRDLDRRLEGLIISFWFLFSFKGLQSVSVKLVCVGVCMCVLKALAPPVTPPSWLSQSGCGAESLHSVFLHSCLSLNYKSISLRCRKMFSFFTATFWSKMVRSYFYFFDCDGYIFFCM